VGTDFSEFQVTLQDVEGEEAETLQKDLQRELNAKFPGVKFAVKTFLSERIEEVISGTKAPFVVKVFGKDLDALEAKAREVEEVLAKVEGAAGVQFRRPDAPQMVIRLNRERLRQFGFRPVEVLETVQTNYQGAQAGQIYDGNRVFDLVVKLNEAARRDP